MSTPPSVDQTVQRDHLLPPTGQADTPGPPNALDEKDEVSKDGFTSPSGPNTPEARGEIIATSPSLSLSPSTLLLSSSILSSSPHLSSPLTSANEDSPREASSSDTSDYDFDSSEEDEIYGSEGESDNMPEGTTPVSVGNEKCDKSVTRDDDNIRAASPVPATRGWQYQYFRSRPDTCLGGGWVPGNPLPNRAYANEHVAVRESPLQGHGVFAAAGIREGTEVLMEAPLLRARGLERLRARRARLGDEERAVYDGLVGYHEFDTCPVRKRWSANSFELARGYNGVFAIASNFNHACRSRRNTQYDWDQRKEVMTFTATRDIEEGEEMLVSYCNYRHVLKEVYGFVCHCGGCDNQAVDLGGDNRY